MRQDTAPGARVDATATLRAVGDQLVVVAHGEFDIASASVLAAALDEACGRSRSVVLDLADAQFIDPYTLRYVATARHRLGIAGCRLTLRNPSPLVRRTLSVTDLAELVEPRG